jgi:hypothetical protein
MSSIVGVGVGVGEGEGVGGGVVLSEVGVQCRASEGWVCVSSRTESNQIGGVSVCVGESWSRVVNELRLASY